MSSNAVVRVGVLGAGHWGPNLIRCFADAAESEVATVCDTDSDRLNLIARRYPGVRVTTDPAVVFEDGNIDAVVIATPTMTHETFTRAALENDKHVLVEKPISTTATSAGELVDLADSRKRILMTGHVFLYNKAVRELKRILADEAFGAMRYLYSRRTNLGPVREDVHAGWDLASHDVSIFLYLKDELPVEVTASARDFIRPGVPDVVFATLYFADGTVAHLHTSWLDPQKVRQVVVVGEGQMLVFDDMNLTEPVRIYNKGWRAEQGAGSGELVDSFGAFRVVLMQGNVVIPPLSTGEPLREECNAFVSAIRDGKPPLADGRLGVDVVRVLEAMDRSIASDSKRVPV